MTQHVSVVSGELHIVKESVARLEHKDAFVSPADRAQAKLAARLDQQSKQLASLRDDMARRDAAHARQLAEQAELHRKEREQQQQAVALMQRRLAEVERLLSALTQDKQPVVGGA